MTDNILNSGWSPATPPKDQMKQAQDEVLRLNKLLQSHCEDIQRKGTIQPGFEHPFYDIYPNALEADLGFTFDLALQLAVAELWLNVTLPALLAKDKPAG